MTVNWTTYTNEAGTETLAVAIQDGEIVTTRSKAIPQEELDAYNRYQFVSKVLDWITTKHIDEGVNAEGVHCSRTIGGKVARFLVHKNQYSLVEIKERRTGEWEFSLGAKGYYTYHFKDVVEFLEDIFDKEGLEVINLKDEIQF